MIEFWFLLLVVFVLYIAECAIWVPAGSIALRLPFNLEQNMRLITTLRSSPRASIAFTYPFSPFSDVLISAPLPLFVSPQGIVADPAISSALEAGRFLAFDRIDRIEHQDRKLLINGNDFVTAASEVQATRLAAFLHRAKKQAARPREKEIEKTIARGLDSESAHSRLREFADKTANLRLDSLGLIVMMFVVSPVLVWRWRLATIWPLLASYLVLNMALIAWEFHRSNQALFPSDGITRWSTIVVILLSPPAAMRATKYLARDIGDGYHALAFAASRCANSEFRNLASWVLRDAIFVPYSNSNLNEPAVDCANWFRRSFHESVVKLIRRHGENPENLISPPLRESERVRSYCPRCLSQFMISEGACTDCAGVPLRPFAPLT